MSTEEQEPKEVSDCCIGEICYCGKAAIHKIEETIFEDTSPRHGYTRYLCGKHFDMALGLPPYGTNYWKNMES